MIKVSLIEDDAGVRERYARLIDAAGDMRCVSQHPNGAHALHHLPAGAPDVVLVDIRMPQLSGIECVRQLKALLPRLLPVMLTQFGDADLIFESLKAGAVGYLLKSDLPDSLPALIRQVHSGGSPMTPEIARRVLGHFHAPPAPLHEEVRITPREEEVLRLVAQGYSSKEIGEKLGCSAVTVDRHVQHICAKLHVSGRVAAASKYFGRKNASDS
ncbi:MAG: response regulator transcription factor [Verrucomicrobia bacterium]|nr:response regulator transcription factor [Verrucomicrobiota bacterium]